MRGKLPLGLTNGYEVSCHLFASLLYKSYTYTHIPPLVTTPVFIELLEAHTDRECNNVRAAVKTLHATPVTPSVYKLQPHDPDRFVLLDIDEVLAILHTDYTYRYQLVYYLYILSQTFNNTTHVSHASTDKLAALSGFSNRTVMRYNSILEEMHIIYIAHSTDMESGTNCIGRYEHADNVIAAAEQKRAHYSAKAARDSNWRRSVSAKYNAYCKNPDPMKAAALAAQVSSYNDYAAQNGLPLKDISIFSLV